MASNYNRKSASSGSRRASSRSRGGSQRTRSRGSANTASRRASSKSPTYRAIPGGRLSSSSGSNRSQVTSVRVGDIDRADRAARARQTYQRYLARIGVALGIVAALVVAGVAVYNSNLFAIESVSVSGVEHLTVADMEELAGVPEGTTLLQVDTAAIEANLLSDAWVESVQINRAFPNTLEIVVTERTIAAVVDVPSAANDATETWAISSDGTWLMLIPDQSDTAAGTVSTKVYEDAASVLHITDVPYGVSPVVGATCTDASIINALDVVTGMTTELADRVTTVQASETISTTLTIENGPDIVFGEAEYIREKELVCLEIIDQHPDGVSYINVRDPENPTWRAL